MSFAIIEHMELDGRSGERLTRCIGPFQTPDEAYGSLNNFRKDYHRYSVVDFEVIESQKEG